jgi:uncharacterized membrane protein YecN with MAPEG domain
MRQLSRTTTTRVGASLLVARVVHPFGMKMDRMNEPARIFGAAVTALVTVAAAATLLWQGVSPHL